MQVRARPSDPPWLKRAFADLGLKEVPGKGSRPRIVQMYALAKNAGVKDDSVPWCSAAVNAWMVESGHAGTRSLLASSWLDWGHKVDTSKPIRRGAVLIFKRGNSSWQGHVCLLVEDNGSVLTVIGGNQSDAVTIARYRRSSLLGARWPEPIVKTEVPPPDVEPVGPEPIEPLPPPDVEPVDPVPLPPVKPSLLKRIRNWFATGGGLGFLYYLTEPMVMITLILVLVLGVIGWLWFIGPDGRKKVRDWFKRQF